MATPRGMDGPDGRGFAPQPSTAEPLDPGTGNGPTRQTRELPPGRGPWREDGPHLKALLSQLGQDISQLAHDELTLAKLELRSVADTLSAEVSNAGKTMVKDLAKVGIALSLAVLAGLALTAGLIMAVGALLGGAYWAGGLIIGVLYLIAAAIFGSSAAKDLQTSEAVRFGATKRRAEQNKDVLAREAQETREFVRHEAEDFKRHASAPAGRSETRH